MGTVRSNIVGIQYYETIYSVDDTIYFDRNPYNEYDNNAIEVSNNLGVLGHIKRQNSKWLGPMIDKGEIYLKGKIIDRGDNWKTPIEIEVFLTKKGRRIISLSPTDSPEQVIHNHILDIYKKSDNYSSETIKKIRDYYRGIINSETILPETHLIFKLLKNKAIRNQKLDLQIFADNARNYFNKIKYGKAIKHKNIVIIPLMIDDPEPCRYISGKKALKEKNLIIEEIGENGQVSRLTATNIGNKPVMLISGEGLKGAKQDRIVNVTIIIKVNHTVEIPVSCVERGRWSYDHNGTQFQSANFATQNIRRSIREDINRNIVTGNKTYDSNQEIVWHNVSKTVKKHNIESETDNLNEVYQAIKTDFNTIIKKIKYSTGAVGVAIFANGKQLSIDLFQHSSLMKENWKNIINSVIIDTEITDKKSSYKCQKIGEMHKDIDTFFKKVCLKTSEPEISPGAGHYIVSRSEHLEAGTLFVDNAVAHISGTITKS
jgi:hypothetical protein